MGCELLTLVPPPPPRDGSERNSSASNQPPGAKGLIANENQHIIRNIPRTKPRTVPISPHKPAPLTALPRSQLSSRSLARLPDSARFRRRSATRSARLCLSFTGLGKENRRSFGRTHPSGRPIAATTAPSVHPHCIPCPLHGRFNSDKATSMTPPNMPPINPRSSTKKTYEPIAKVQEKRNPTSATQSMPERVPPSR